MEKILFKGESLYGRYQVVDRVYEGRPARLLMSGKEAPQSGLARDDNPELLFDYNQRFMEIALSLQPRSVLVIGGGAFTLPKALVERFETVRVDAVEVDPLLPRIAYEYFDLPQHPHLRVITQGGREFIDAASERYDLVVVDAFDEYDIPRPLLTVQAAKRYAKLLSPGGVLAINIIAAYSGHRPTLVHQMLATFREVFTSIDIYPADPYYGKRGEQNLLFVATQGPPPSFDYLQSAEVYPVVRADDHLRMVDA